MAKKNEEMQQDITEQVERKGLMRFRELIEEVAKLPDEQINNVALFTEGFITHASMSK